MEQITINNKTYQLDVERAKELKILKEYDEPIYFKDLKNGDVIQYYQPSANKWSNCYLMVNHNLQCSGQIVSFEYSGYIRLSWFGSYNDTKFRVLNIKINRWIETVEELNSYRKNS